MSLNHAAPAPQAPRFAGKLTHEQLASLVARIGDGRVFVGPLYLAWEEDKGFYRWCIPVVTTGGELGDTVLCTRHRFGVYATKPMAAGGRLTPKQAAHQYMLLGLSIMEGLARRGGFARLDTYEDEADFLADIGQVRPDAAGLAKAELRNVEVHAEASAHAGKLWQRCMAEAGRS
jgi:hypothetical protein